MDLLAEPFVGGCDYDFDITAPLGERQRNRQAVSNLMGLVVIEEEADPHTGVTDTWARTRIGQAVELERSLRIQPLLQKPWRQ
jgi:hypothetical protein